MSLIPKHPDLGIYLALSLLVLLITLPFLGHAFYIDEPLFMRIARQIQSQPMNPYGFYYQWNLYPEPMHQIAAFPPFFSYFLAAVSWGNPFPPEWTIHLSLVPFALASVLCLYALSRQLGFSRPESGFGAVLLAISPVFVISSGMAMPDVATLATSLLAMVLALRGWKGGSWGSLIVAGVFLGLSPLLRYNGAPMILILGMLGLAFTPSKIKAFLPSLIGLGFVVLWTVVSSLGKSGAHTTEVFSVFAKFSGWMSRFWAMNIHLSLSTFIPFLLLPWFFRRKVFWWGLVLFFSLDFAIFASPDIKRFALFPDILFFALGLSILLYLFCVFWQRTAQLQLLQVSRKSEGAWHEFQIRLKTLSSLYRNETWIDWVFIVWIAGMLFVPIIYVHFAAKYLLMMQPPLILLVVKKLRESPAPQIKRFAWVFAPALALSLLVAWADFSFANLYREEAIQARRMVFSPLEQSPMSPDRWVWFTGHWGWQYYLEKEGGIPLPALFEDLQKGDWILTSKYASATDLTKGLEDKLEQEISDPKMIPIPIRTMNPYARTGFYSNHWGPLPYNFSRTPAEVFNYFRVKP